ncbi:VanZ family protein [Microbacterium sp. YY-01]
MALSLIAFWPRHVDEALSPWIRRVVKYVPLVTYDRIEFAANVGLFVPFGLLLAFMLVQHRYLVLPIAFIATVTIESVQEVLLDNRTSSMRDIIANTAGACIGLVLAVVIETAQQRAKQRRATPDQ